MYEERSQERYGFWQLIIGTVVRRVLECGDLKHGFARVLRCPFSQAGMIEFTDAGKVIDKTEHNAVGRFPEPGDDELPVGPARNFQVFEPLDFLAEVTQRIPDPGSHQVRCCGWDSNKT